MSKVLVVDDDEQMRRLLRESFLRNGYVVDTAEDGLDAIKAIELQVPDIVILDLVMPNQEGIETLIQIKREHPSIPVIAVSGGGRIAPKDYLDVASQLGATRTFAKPFRLEDVLKAVFELTHPNRNARGNR
jgi:DNA-binding NtrC family response regulator